LLSGRIDHDCSEAPPLPAECAAIFFRPGPCAQGAPAGTPQNLKDGRPSDVRTAAKRSGQGARLKLAIETDARKCLKVGQPVYRIGILWPASGYPARSKLFRVVAAWRAAGDPRSAWEFLFGERLGRRYRQGAEAQGDVTQAWHAGYGRKFPDLSQGRSLASGHRLHLERHPPRGGPGVPNGRLDQRGRAKAFTICDANPRRPFAQALA